MRGKRMTRRLLVLPIALFAGVFAATWIFLDAREAARPLPGDVVFLRLAAGGGASWIQLYNRTDHRIDLTGAVVSDGQHISTLEGDLTIDAHDTLLASRTATAGAPGPARTRAFWRGFSISKNGGEIVLLMNRERDTMLDFLQTVPMDAEQYLARVKPDENRWLRHGRCAPGPIGCRGVPITVAARAGTPSGSGQRPLELMDFLTRFAKQSAVLIASLAALITGVVQLISVLRRKPSPPPPAALPPASLPTRSGVAG